MSGLFFAPDSLVQARYVEPGNNYEKAKNWRIDRYQRDISQKKSPRKSPVPNPPFWGGERPPFWFFENNTESMHF